MIAQVVKDGTVINIIEIDDTATIVPNGSSVAGGPSGEWTAPAGTKIMTVAGAGLGWIVSGKTLIPPPQE